MAISDMAISDMAISDMAISDMAISDMAISETDLPKAYIEEDGERAAWTAVRIESASVPNRRSYQPASVATRP